MTFHLISLYRSYYNYTSLSNYIGLARIYLYQVLDHLINKSLTRLTFLLKVSTESPNSMEP